jgi:hypothetical protein
MTFRELSDMCKGVLYPKRTASPDTVVTDRDIRSGKFFPVFSGSRISGSIMPGFAIEHGQVVLKYQEVKGIRVKAPAIVPQKSGTVKLSSVSTYAMHTKYADGHEDIEDNKETRVSPAYTTDTDGWNVMKDGMLEYPDNRTEDTVKVTITASYTVNGVTHVDRSVVRQKPVSYTDWHVISTNNKGIRVYQSADVIPYDGGSLTITTELIYDAIEAVTNTFGETVKQRTVTGLTSDVSNLVRYSGAQPVAGAFRFAPKQPGDPETVEEITVSYGGYSDTVTIRQEAGREVKYEHRFSFDGKRSKTLKQEHASGSTIHVDFSNDTVGIVDGDVFSVTKGPEVAVACNVSWMRASTEGCHLEVIMDGNEGPERKGTAILRSGADTIRLNVIQPEANVIKTRYSVVFPEHTEYSHESLLEEPIKVSITAENDYGFFRRSCSIEPGIRVGMMLFGKTSVERIVNSRENYEVYVSPVKGDECTLVVAITDAEGIRRGGGRYQFSVACGPMERVHLTVSVSSRAGKDITSDGMEMTIDGIPFTLSPYWVCPGMDEDEVFNSTITIPKANRHIAEVKKLNKSIAFESTTELKWKILL